MLQHTTHTNETHVAALGERQAQLEHRVEHYSAAIRTAEVPDPSVGRELDAARSLLAQVHSELATLQAHHHDAQ